MPQVKDPDIEKPEVPGPNQPYTLAINYLKGELPDFFRYDSIIKMLYIAPKTFEQIGSYQLFIVLRDKHMTKPLESVYRLEVVVGRPPLTQELWNTLAASGNPLYDRLKVVTVEISKISEVGVVTLQFNDTDSFNPKVIKPHMINMKAFLVYSRKEGDYLNKDFVNFTITRISESRMYLKLNFKDPSMISRSQTPDQLVFEVDPF